MILRWHIWALVLPLLIGLPARGRAEECKGLTVSSVGFAGCERGACANKRILADLARLTDLMGTPWSADAVYRAEERLRLTGYFKEVVSSCETTPEVEAEVTFNVVPNRYVRSIGLSGTKVLFLSDLEKRLFIHEGAVFNPGTKESGDRLDRQVTNLISYMRQEGFDLAVVEPEVVPVEPDLVDIFLRVDEGRVSRVEKVTVVLDLPGGKDVPGQYSCPQLNERDIIRVTGVQRGALYTGKTSRTVKKAVRDFLQQYGFQSPRKTVTYVSEEEELKVTVKVRTCFSILIFEREERQAHQQGFERTDEIEFYEVLPFRESGVFDQREALLGIDELKVYYKTRGYLFVEIEMQFVDYREMFGGWPYPLLGGVTYRVTRGQPTEIRELKLNGTRAFTEDVLLGLMQTRRYDFFGVGGYLEVERLFGDLDVLKKHYLDNGYFRMNYPGARGKDDQVRVQLIRQKDRTVWRYHFLDKSFDVIKPDWENAVRIHIGIDEGQGSIIGKIDFQGIKSFSPEALLALLPIKAGGSFSAKLVRSARAVIENRYARLGRPSTVTVSCAALDPEVPVGECKVADVRSLRVNLVFKVEEGPLLLMGEALVVGNLKTARSVIVRDLPKEGEPFDRGRIDAAIRRLRNLGIFSSVRIVKVGMNEEPPRGKIAVIIQVEEANTRFMEFSAGFQQMYDRGEGPEQKMSGEVSEVLSTSLHNTGSPLSGSASQRRLRFPDVLLTGEVSYTDRNFAGRGKHLRLPVKYGFTTNDPARYAGFSPTYYDSRFLSTDIAMRLTPLVVFDKALSWVDKFEYGLENEFSFLVTTGVYVSLENRLTRLSWKQPTDTEYEPQEFQVSLAPQLRFDFRDNPINPMSGFYFMSKVTYLNAVEDRKAANSSGEDPKGEARRANFLKYELQGQAYASIRKTVVLALNLRYGHAWSPEGSDTDLPPFHKFYLGATSGMRGFPARGVLQYDATGFPLTEKIPTAEDEPAREEVILGAETLLNGSLELRFPLLRNSGIWAATFLDAGALAPDLDPENFHSQSFRFSAGIGVRWLIGNQIPIRLDYGFVIDRRCREVDPLNPAVCVARDDPGALDFGLLYTF